MINRISEHILLLTLIAIVECLPDDVQPISLSVIKLTDHGAIIRWSGVDIGPGQENPKCTLYYEAASSTKGLVSPDYRPQVYTIELTLLDPNTTYHVFMSCHEKGTKYQSKTITLTTALKGQTIDLNSTQIPSTSQPYLHQNPSQPGTAEVPSVQRERMLVDLNPIDVGIGVVFGAVGVAVIAVVLYFVIKRVRRQQRIRRFLQYRHQENDPFPGLEQRDDDGQRI